MNADRTAPRQWAESAGGPRPFGFPVLVLLLTLFGMIAFSIQGGLGASNLPPAMGAIMPSAGRGYVAGVFYVLALFALMVGLGDVLRLGVRMWPHTLFLVFAAASAAWSFNPAWVLIFVGNCVGIWLVGVATARRWSLSRGQLYAAFHWGMVVYLLASVAVVIAVPTIGIRQISDSFGGVADRWQGLAVHPNRFAYSTVLLVWAALAGHWTPEARLLRRASYVTIPLALAVAAFGANSVTATIADLGMIATFVLWPRPGGGRSPVRLILYATAAVAIVVVGVYALSDVLEAHGPVRVVGRDFGSFTGRVQLWEAGWMAIVRRPWVGWSFDDLASFLQFANGFFGYGQFHNGWIDIAVRGGVVGLLLALAMMGRFIAVTLRLFRIDPMSARISTLFFVALMIENLTEAQLCESGHPLWTMFVALWAMNEVQVMRAPKPVRARPLAPAAGLRDVELEVAKPLPSPGRP